MYYDSEEFITPAFVNKPMVRIGACRYVFFLYEDWGVLPKHAFDSEHGGSVRGLKVYNEAQTIFSLLLCLLSKKGR